jgi:hypothetical protein
MLHFYGEDPSAMPPLTNIIPQDYLWLPTPSAYPQLPSVLLVDTVSAIRNLMAVGVAATKGPLNVDYLIAEKFLFSFSYSGFNLLRNFWCSLLNADF